VYRQYTVICTPFVVVVVIDVFVFPFGVYAFVFVFEMAGLNLAIHYIIVMSF